MSTHALVKIDNIYLYRHFDGYPEETGTDLEKYLEFGDAQSLATILQDTNKYRIVEDENYFVHYIYDVDLNNKSIIGYHAVNSHDKGEIVFKVKKEEK